MNGVGDFRSKQCLEFLKEADIVVTNPPFSLFRWFIGQLVKYDKKFLILGNNNALTYRDIFPMFKENKIWLGTQYNKSMKFVKPGKLTCIIPACSWFTNLKHDKRNKPLSLSKSYSPEKYPKYDNYDAINVDKVVDIPKDYSGKMGVPITFLGKHNSNQFKIIGLCRTLAYQLTGVCEKCLLNGKEMYVRVIIKRIM